MQKSVQSQRIEIFDGMRGLASVIVMIFHMAVWTVYGYSANEYKIFCQLILVGGDTDTLETDLGRQ